MNVELRSQIEKLGIDLTPEMISGTQAIFTARFGGIDPSTRIERDLRYGPDERNRLDIFRRDGTADAPVLVFIHGGGFVMGDKRVADTPFYDNIGDFAARNGLVGVTLTYRLAPAHPWPSGPEDMAAAVAWLSDNIGRYGGDPAQIFLMGQSAGATHVASYLAHSRFHAAPGSGIAGAVMMSGIYDVAAAAPNQFQAAYYGEDRSSYGSCSTDAGLVASQVPQLFTVSEFDGEEFQVQAAALTATFARSHRRFPRMLYLTGHNHISPVLQIGSAGDRLGRDVLDFTAAVGAQENI
jgi:triacylglycerol lipase